MPLWFRLGPFSTGRTRIYIGTVRMTPSNQPGWGVVCLSVELRVRRRPRLFALQLFGRTLSDYLHSLVDLPFIGPPISSNFPFIGSRLIHTKPRQLVSSQPAKPPHQATGISKTTNSTRQDPTAPRGGSGLVRTLKFYLVNIF